MKENLFKNITLRDSPMKMRRILILEDMDSDADLMEFELQDTGIPFTSRREPMQFLNPIWSAPPR